MMKKVLCLLLAALLVAGMLPLSSRVAAVEEMKASDELVELIKKYEGFSKYPVWDNSQYSVGWGTRCPDDKYQEYLDNGIPLEDAEELLRHYITLFEGELNKFMTKYGFQMNQQQFDAALCLTFNCGGGWTYQTEGILANAVRSGASGNALIYAFCLWSKSASGGLVGRRLAEANLYLNGVYSTRKPANYSYVYFDANGGTLNYNVQGFDTALEPAQIFIEITAAPTVNVDGVEKPCTFAGWYTEKEGGTKIEALDGSLREASTLYAHWNAPDGSAVDPVVPEVTPTYGIAVTVTGDKADVRSGPSTKSSVLYAIQGGTRITITHTAKDAAGSLWGKFSYNSKVGWIPLDLTDYEEVINNLPPAVTGTVTVGSTLNIRSGPGTTYEVKGSYVNGERITILDRRTVGTVTWGRTDRGWVSMEYVKLDEPSDPDTTDPTTPETQPPVTQPPETQPPVTQPPETKPPVTQPPETKPPVTQPPETKPPVTQPPETKPPVTQPPETKPPVTQPPETKPPAPTEPPYEAWVGVVKVTTWLNVRERPDRYSKSVDMLINGEKVTILDETTADGMRWGKTEKGWISLQYVLKEDEAQNPTEPPETQPPVTQPPETQPPVTQPPETQPPKPTVPETQPPKPTEPSDTLDGKWSGTVTAKESLVVRREPGRAGENVGTFSSGDPVTITRKTALDGKIWGKTEKGWICLDYVNLKNDSGNPVERAPTPPAGVVLDEPLVMTVNMCSLRVRGAAGITARIVEFLPFGQQVTVLETKTVGSARWGRTEHGWIDLRYVL